MKIDRERSKRNPLRYGFYLIGLLFLIFMGLGLLNPIQRQEAFVKIEQQNGKLIPILISVDSLSLWYPNIVSAEIIQGEYAKTGSKYDLFMIDGQKNRCTFTKIDTSIGLFVYTIESDVGTRELSIEVKDLENGSTDLVVNSRIKGSDILTRSILNFMNGMYQKELNNTTNRLKDAVEK